MVNVNFTFDGDLVKLDQQGYIEGLVKRYFPDGLPSRVQRGSLPYTPDLPQLVSDAQAMPVASEDSPLLKPFQSIVGALLYCAVHTRPDVAYPVGMLCRVMARPTVELQLAAERVLAYLYRNRHLGLTFNGEPTDLVAYADSDWAVQKSTTGWVVMLQNAAIAWGSKRQPCVALSSCEAEIIAASDAAKEVTYLKQLLAELNVGMDGKQPVELRVDNQAARDLAYNPELHARTKHVNRRHFWVREKVEDLTLTVPFVKSHENLADFFTKCLPGKTFFAVRNQIMNITI